MISGDKLTFNFDYGLTTDRINDIKKQGGNPPKGVGPDGGGSLEALMRGLGDTDNDIYLDGPDLVGGDNNTIGKWKGLTIGNMLKKAKIRYEEVDLDEKKKGTAHASLKDVMALDKKNAADKKQAKKDKKRDDANRKSNRAAGMEELEIDEGFSSKEIKMAIGVASDKRYAGGNMTGAVDAIDKIKKGLSDHPQVAAVLRRQNEEVELGEAKFTVKYDKNGKNYTDIIMAKDKAPEK